MNPELYAAFLAVSLAVIVVPGPSLLLIASTALEAGRRAGFAAVAGTAVAMTGQLLLAGLASAAVLGGVEGWGRWLRWAGAAVLLGLAARYWRDARHPPGAASRRRFGGPFVSGLVVSATNPTTLVFFVAFFPQFVSPAAPAGPQLVVLGASFQVLALAVDLTCATLAGRAALRFATPSRHALRGRVAAAMLVLAAALTVLARAKG